MNIGGVDIPRNDMLVIVLVAWIMIWVGFQLSFPYNLLSVAIYFLFTLGMTAIWYREGRLKNFDDKESQV